MGKFQLNKKGEDPIKIYEDTFKIAEGTVETHLDKLGKQPKPISREYIYPKASEGHIWGDWFSDNFKEEYTMDQSGTYRCKHCDAWFDMYMHSQEVAKYHLAGHGIVIGESKASEDSDGKDHDNDGDIDSEDYLKSRDIAIKSNTEEKYINALWKSVETIASEAESCKQCGRLGWSSDPKNCDDCSDPAGDGYEPDLDDTSWNGELGTGLY